MEAMQQSASLRTGVPTVAVLFEASDQAGATALVAALAARALNAVPIVRADGDVEAALAAAVPNIVLNATATPVAGVRTDVPVLAVSLKNSPDGDRIAFIADLARNWTRFLRATPIERRIVVALVTAPGGAGVAPDAAEAAIAVLRALAASGHRVAAIPVNGAALAALLDAGPSNAAPYRFSDETFPRSDYDTWFATLPRALQDQVHARWGAPERDPFFREGELDCGRFAIAAQRCGGVIVALEPARGDGSDQGPTHAYLAFQAWIADGVRAHAVVRLDNLGAWRPGTALTLAPARFPDTAQGPLPQLHPVTLPA